MSRSASRRAVLLLAAAFAAGCGGGGEHAAHPPRLPADIARVLAARSDALAVSLERNDSCEAVRRAGDLRQAASLAIASGRIPVAFRRKLTDAVTRLVAAVPACAPSGGNEGGDHDHGKHKGEGKHSGKGKD